MRQLLPVRTIDPGVDLIEVAEARRQCRVDHNDDDETLKEIVADVTGHLEAPDGILRVCLLKQTWQDTWSGFPCSTQRIRLSVEPLIAVQTVEYVAEGASTWSTLASDKWSGYADTLGAWVELVDGEEWPDTATRPDAVRITYTAGFGDKKEKVPAAIRRAAKLLVGHFYENREETLVGVTASNLPTGAATLLRPFLRIPG